MKKIPLLILFLLTSLLGNAQQLYDYYYGYIDGFRKGCGCSNEVRKTNDLIYHAGSKSDGYNAGYVDGRIFLQNNSNNQQASDPPLYNPNVELIERVLAEKQRLLNERRQYLQAEFTSIEDIVLSIQNLTESQKKYYDDFINLLNKYVQYDITVNSTYNQIINWMRQQKTYFLTW